MTVAVSSAPKDTTNEEYEEDSGGGNVVVTPLLDNSGVIHSNGTTEQKTK